MSDMNKISKKRLPFFVVVVENKPSLSFKTVGGHILLFSDKISRTVLKDWNSYLFVVANRIDKTGTFLFYLVPLNFLI